MVKTSILKQLKKLLGDVDKDVLAFLTGDEAMALLPAEHLDLAVLEWIYQCFLRPEIFKSFSFQSR